MLRMFEQYRIDSIYVETFIFVGSSSGIIPHLKEKFTNYTMEREKQMKLFYIIISDDICELMDIQKEVNSNEIAKKYNTTVTALQDKNHLESYVERIRMVNSNKYENNYMSLMESVQKSIELQLIKNFCKRKLKWEKDKIQNVTERQDIKSLDKFIHYPHFTIQEKDKIKILKQLFKELLQ